MRKPRLWEEFTVMMEFKHLPGHQIPMCGLCGNSGRIHLVTPIPPKGIIGDPPVLDAFCICPNGRAIKRREAWLARRNEVK